MRTGGGSHCTTSEEQHHWPGGGLSFTRNFFPSLALPHPPLSGQFLENSWYSANPCLLSLAMLSVRGEEQKENPTRETFSKLTSLAQARGEEQGTRCCWLAGAHRRRGNGQQGSDANTR